jgi:hypothetical protein
MSLQARRTSWVRDRRERTTPAGDDGEHLLVADEVVLVGDALDGDTITSLTFCEEALNRSGQLAFTAFFEDPETFELRTAVFRATPVLP